MKKITTSQLLERIKEEMSYDSVEQIQVTYCCPVLMGGYKKENHQIFRADADEVVNAISEHGSEIAIGKIDIAYTEDDFRRTLFIDIVEL